ncbi:hypothetical protein ANN_27429 [Periplaneta americana]|uniref:Uncharacterized protein n=1 Tax=Periplaneta americana TaxID=6978 RepID=A0ABQ8RVQ2_PERAM|nr:hypothetical protein ANN_27429 [Periplaneta americana]
MIKKSKREQEYENRKLFSIGQTHVNTISKFIASRKGASDKRGGDHKVGKYEAKRKKVVESKGILYVNDTETTWKLIFYFDLQVQPLPKFNIGEAYYTHQISFYYSCVTNIQATEPACYDDNNALSESAMRISYKICHEIAKELKTFNEGEFIKRCLIILADELCPQQVRKCSIRLSREP